MTSNTGSIISRMSTFISSRLNPLKPSAPNTTSNTSALTGMRATSENLTEASQAILSNRPNRNENYWRDAWREKDFSNAFFTSEMLQATITINVPVEFQNQYIGQFIKSTPKEKVDWKKEGF